MRILVSFHLQSNRLTSRKVRTGKAGENFRERHTHDLMDPSLPKMEKLSNRMRPENVQTNMRANCEDKYYSMQYNIAESFIWLTFNRFFMFLLATLLVGNIGGPQIFHISVISAISVDPEFFAHPKLKTLATTT